MTNEENNHLMDQFKEKSLGKKIDSEVGPEVIPVDNKQKVAPIDPGEIFDDFGDSIKEKEPEL
jgi:hypothetical protein